MTTSSDIRAAEIRQLILELLPSSAETTPRIFGPGTPLDSLGLGNCLADLEGRLAQKYERDLVLASDRAMSRSQSPFRDVDALTAYILELLAE